MARKKSPGRKAVEKAVKHAKRVTVKGYRRKGSVAAHSRGWPHKHRK